MIVGENQNKPKEYVRVIVITFLMGVLLYSCYSERKAKSQFSRAAVAYPKLPAEYCANEFPIKDSVIKDTVITTDTLYVQGEDHDVVDTVVTKDTVRITITKTLPAKIITNTIHIMDTVIQENTAKIKACEIDKSILTGLLKDKTDEAAKYKHKAMVRGITMWALIFIIIGAGGMWIYFKAKKLPTKVIN